ncbi:MAG TPA: biotin/lipoyl-containing protein [Anaerolineales bacterium]|nr:biotin/lipoyl-containing protein [Anaerolineales bacterium]
MRHRFLYNEREFEIEILRTGGGAVVRSGGEEHEVVVRELGDGRVELAFPGRTVTVHAAVDGDTVWVACAGRTYELRRSGLARTRRHTAAGDAEGALRAPMPGQVRLVDVAVGDPVTKGQTLLLLEAMKMEIRIQSPFDGTVTALPVAPGEQVEREQVVVEISKN